MALIEYTAFPQVPRAAVRLLWVHDYCDGILSGILRYEDRLHYYELCEDGARSTRYAIRVLSDAQVLDEEKWHALFQEHVGAHWDGDTRDEAVKPMSEWNKFYGPYGQAARMDYSVCPIVGWFEI